MVFQAPPKADQVCGGGVYIKRLIGLPGETVHEDGSGFIYINGKQLKEPYLRRDLRLGDSVHFDKTWRVPKSDYFFMGDNRGMSCDSRNWGPVPGGNILGKVVKIERHS